ncbi:type VI secretion system baseplate subunit TssG [Teredinibacter haidensis]|uniref:type VI secretion system baseplate subunit TssG n=1 Tax=Teredinibacter haidensis TaxID=2731755 RepID=UPI000948AEE9|nr:type VI secretion system baseplate subunit TssG [Teredinibacter haidensis]
MPSPRWRKNTSVIKDLTENPENYSFSQVVRLLLRAASYNKKLGSRTIGKEQASNPVGRFSPPASEAIRFLGNPSLSFPNSEVEQVTPNAQRTPKESHNQWQVTVNLIGLMGSMGVLPYHYTEFLMQRIKQKDSAMLHFINIFNHRTTSLFYQASIKYRLPFAYENSKLEGNATRDSHTQALLSLIGLGTKHLNHRNVIQDESLIYFSGLLSQQVKTSTGLKQMLQAYFDVPIEIKQFIGEWHNLIDEVRTRLPTRTNKKGQNVILGRSTILGSNGWFSQGKTRITLGPLNKEQYYRFAPGTRNLKALNELVRLYLGLEREFDFEIQVSRKDIPNKIALSKDKQPIIGWSTWLSSKPLDHTQHNEIMRIHVSANQLK